MTEYENGSKWRCDYVVNVAGYGSPQIILIIIASKECKLKIPEALCYRILFNYDQLKQYLFYMLYEMRKNMLMNTHLILSMNKHFISNQYKNLCNLMLLQVVKFPSHLQ